MQYVSELIGSPVRDPDGRVIGKVADGQVLLAADSGVVSFDQHPSADGREKIAGRISHMRRECERAKRSTVQQRRGRKISADVVDRVAEDISQRNVERHFVSRARNER